MCAVNIGILNFPDVSHRYFLLIRKAYIRVSAMALILATADIVAINSKAIYLDNLWRNCKF